MPRRERITHAGFYHTVCRGVERRNVFLDSDDFEQFLAFLKSLKKEFDIIVHSFCLMKNHYHILLETKEDNISLAMKYILIKRIVNLYFFVRVFLFNYLYSVN